MSLSADHRLAAARCSSCPKMCRGVCPTLEVTRNERHQPWGHAHEVMGAVRSAETGGAGFASASLAEAAYACATCGACTVPCEVEGVETPTLAWAVRAAVWEAGAAPEVARRAVAEATAGRVLVSEDPPRWEEPSASSSRPDGVEAGAEWLLLAGCGVLGRRPGSAEAAALALSEAGVSATRPGRHVCCGAVARDLGDAEAARAGADAVVAQVRSLGLTRIAVQSPSCAHHLAAALDGSQVEVRTLAEVLASAPVDAAEPGSRGSVAYHDACFLVRHLAVADQPRTLLARAGYTVSSLGAPATTRCGGRGGGLELTNPEIADGYLRLLAGQVAASGLGAVVTACAPCAAALATVMPPGIDVLELAEALAGEAGGGGR